MSGNANVRMIAMLLALGLNGDGAIEARLPPHQVPRKQSQEQPAALVAEAAAALERGDSVSAVALLHRVLALDPKNLVARTYLGILADRAGDLPEAERQRRELYQPGATPRDCHEIQHKG